MLISDSEARNAEREALKERLGLARLLRADESKAPAARDVMKIKRIMTAAASRSAAYDEELREPGTQALFDLGALYFVRPGETDRS